MPYVSKPTEMNTHAAEGHRRGPRYRSTPAERTHDVHAGHREQPINQTYSNADQNAPKEPPDRQRSQRETNRSLEHARDSYDTHTIFNYNRQPQTVRPKTSLQKTACNSQAMYNPGIQPQISHPMAMTLPRHYFQEPPDTYYNQIPVLQNRNMQDTYSTRLNPEPQPRTGNYDARPPTTYPPMAMPPIQSETGYVTGSDATVPLLERLADLLSNSRDHLPKMEPEVFNGNLLKFPVWIKSFDAIIESHTQSPAERLYFLSKYTSGAAKEAIEGFLTLNDDQAYLRAKYTLNTRFGDRYKV